MPAENAWLRLSRAIFSVFIEVAFFWWFRLFQWLRRRSPKSIHSRALFNAHSYEEWEAAAFQLDEILGNDLWRQNAASKYYDYRLLYERLQSLISSRESEDISGLVNLLRSGLVRNLGNITAFRLYDRAYAGTKLLIEDYITQVVLAIDAVAVQPTSPGGLTRQAGGGIGLTSQAKLDFLHDTRQAFGRTALVLQGGAIFGICHLGVVKALHLRGILPRIVVGTGAGALVAALVGVHTEDELGDLLKASSINISAFNAEQDDKSHPGRTTWFWTAIRRSYRFLTKGYFLDVAALEKCVEDNVGDVTFEEAYSRTRKVLNISVPNDAGSGVPSLFNYLTTPNVLIRSAAVASNSSPAMFPPVTILCKDLDGHVHLWATDLTTGNKTAVPLGEMRDTPLSRVAELFNVNHYIVSQARPYIAPFLQSKENVSFSALRHANSRRRGVLLPLLRVFGLEIQHRLRQLDTFGLIPNSVRRFLVDDIIPSAHITLVPELAVKDMLRLLERPTRDRMEQWILKGERSVWPTITALKVRCAIENEIDRAYQLVRRRKPMDVMGGLVDPGSPGIPRSQLRGAGEKRKRRKPSNAAV